MADRCRPRAGTKSLFQGLVGGIVEALLSERLAAKNTQQRRGVVLVLHALREFNHVIPALGLRVELSERDRRVGRRLELLDDIDRAGNVSLVLLELGERE